MKKLTLIEIEKEILIKALTKLLLTDELNKGENETAGILLMALKKL